MAASPTFQTPTTVLNFEDIGSSLLNRTLVTITCSLSLLGALLIIVTYTAWKDVRSCSRQILVYISIADSVVAASYMIGVLLPDNANSTACVTQSFFSTAANLCSFFWTLFLSIYLYAAVARLTPAKNFLWFFHIIGWGFPLFIVLLAWEKGALGNDRDIYSSGWCWIRVQDNSNDDVIWMLVTGKFWEIAVFILILIFYGLLKCHLRTEVKMVPCRVKEEARKADKQLTLVPIIFLFLRSWSMIRFCIYLVSSAQQSQSLLDAQEILIYLQGVCNSAQGFVNFLLFWLFTTKFQNNLRRVAHKYCPCLRDKYTFIPGECINVEYSNNSRYPQYSDTGETSAIFKTSDFYGPKYSYYTVSFEMNESDPRSHMHYLGSSENKA